MKLRLPRLKPVQWLALGAGALAGLAILYVVLVQTGALEALRQLPVRAWVEQIAAMGPGPFLLALAVLPAFGAPVSVFYLVAGAVFAAHGGLGMALIGCFAAISVNVALTYAMGRWLMHPVIERLVRRFGWKVPKVQHEDRWVVALLLRITPGPPFFVQSYLLALGRVPFGVYMVVSVAVAFPLSAPVIYFGDSLAAGSSGKLVFGVLFIIAVALIIRLVRKRVAQRHPTAVAEAAGEAMPTVTELPPSS